MQIIKKIIANDTYLNRPVPDDFLH